VRAERHPHCLSRCVQMPSPKPTVMSSPVVTERQRSRAAESDFKHATVMSPSPPSTTTAAAVATTTEKEPSPEDSVGKLDELETELELDLENMKLDNIDTTVCVGCDALCCCDGEHCSIPLC